MYIIIFLIYKILLLFIHSWLLKFIQFKIQFHSDIKKIPYFRLATQLYYNHVCKKLRKNLNTTLKINIIFICCFFLISTSLKKQKKYNNTFYLFFYLLLQIFYKKCFIKTPYRFRKKSAAKLILIFIKTKKNDKLFKKTSFFFNDLPTLQTWRGDPLDMPFLLMFRKICNFLNPPPPLLSQRIEANLIFLIKKFFRN